MRRRHAGGPALDWLTARPIAHRGLHDAAAGTVENTAAAFAAAMAAGYAIECDLQLSADGEAMVFHDDRLERLTAASGPVAARTAAELRRIAFRAGRDGMASLADLLDQVAGRVGLVIEIKSRFDGDLRLAERAAAVTEAYDGRFALMSFDPEVVAFLRARVPGVARGIVADDMTHAEWAALSLPRRLAMRHMWHVDETAPHFLSYDQARLPSPASRGFRSAGRPVICWTVRSAEAASRALRWCDQITFEGYRP